MTVQGGRRGSGGVIQEQVAWEEQVRRTTRNLGGRVEEQRLKALLTLPPPQRMCWSGSGVP